MDDIKTLIFRTDRLGDFIISCPFILSYKKKFPNNEISIVSSEYNSGYIKNFDFINQIIPLKNEIKFFPKLLILIKMILTLRKTKFKDIIVLDGKKRSFFISLFLKGDKSILLQSKELELFSKIFNYKIVINYEIQSQLKNFSFLASLLNFNINQREINIYKNYKLAKKYFFKKKYIIIHLDEKWYTDYYYRDFTNINPKPEQIENFINKILTITDNNFEIVLTSGSKKLEHLTKYILEFKTKDNKVFEKINDNNRITYLHNTTFNDLESLVRDSSFLICCEGGVSHVSHNFDIDTIAFFEESRLQHTQYWTGHMNKLSLYQRKNMTDLLIDGVFFNLFKNKIKNII